MKTQNMVIAFGIIGLFLMAGLVAGDIYTGLIDRAEKDKPVLSEELKDEIGTYYVFKISDLHRRLVWSNGSILCSRTREMINGELVYSKEWKDVEQWCFEHKDDVKVEKIPDEKVVLSTKIVEDIK